MSKNPVRVAAGFKAARTRRGEKPEAPPPAFDEPVHQAMLDHLRLTNPAAHLRIAHRLGRLL